MAFQDDVQSQPLHGSVASPFAHAEASLPTAPQKKGFPVVWIAVAAALLLSGTIAGTFLSRHLNDPLRTMETFPTGKYFENYHALAGAKFKGELRVEADLGWKEGTGRLMLFSTPADNRSVAVMIPTHLANLYFVKGQTYLAELEVKEGGLVYAISCKKH